MPKSKKRPVFGEKFVLPAIVGVFVLFLAAAGIKMADMGYLSKSGRTVPVYDDFPDFKLTERSGREISKKDLLGRVWVMDFIFTRCGGQCPIMSRAMSKLTKEFPGVKYLSITSDPEYDTPGKLTDYADGYEADPNDWLFLTGDKQAVSDVAVALKLSKMDEPAMHSGHFVLVDKKGRVRGYYDPNDPERLKALKRDIRDIL
jgi:protein SCO1/2